MKKQYRKKLIEILRAGGILSKNKILSVLGIDYSDEEMVQSVFNELNDLVTDGLVESSLRGWKWRGWTVMDNGHLLPHR
jgi:oligoendopeptidase F